METISSDSERKPHANGYSSGGGGKGGQESPPSFAPPSLPKENISYSWSNMNVFTRLEHRQNRVLNAVQNLLQRNRPQQRKHILKNGEW